MPIDMRTAPYAALLLRVTLGIYAIAHIYWKFYIRPDGFDGWWNGLITAGYPSWVILYVLSGEFLGALLLIPGIFTRWVALYAMAPMRSCLRRLSRSLAATAGRCPPNRKDSSQCAATAQ